MLSFIKDLFEKIKNFFTGSKGSVTVNVTNSCTHDHAKQEPKEVVMKNNVEATKPPVAKVEPKPEPVKTEPKPVTQTPAKKTAAKSATKTGTKKSTPRRKKPAKTQTNS